MSMICRFPAAALALLLAAQPLAAATPLEPPLLPLDVALRQAFENAPLLAEAEAAQAAERARRAQAARRPNPELELEAENWGGSGSLSGFNSAEFTISVAQPLELGGRRHARMAAAGAAALAADRGYDLARLDLEAAVRCAYVEAVAAQERLSLARSQAAAARKWSHPGARRPAAATVSARAEAAEAELALEAAFEALRSARGRLAALTGSQTADFTLVTDELYQSPRPAPAAATDPERELAGADVDQARGALRLARAERTPDVVVGAGVKRLEGERSTAFVATLALPLPFFDRNSGNVAAAAAEVQRAEAVAARVAIETRVRAENARAAFVAARRRLDLISQAILPAAEEALAAARRERGNGRASLDDLIDAEAAVADAAGRRIDAALDLQRAAIELDRANGVGRGTAP